MYGRSSSEESSVWIAGDCSGWLSADGDETIKTKMVVVELRCEPLQCRTLFTALSVIFSRCICTSCYVTTSTSSALLVGISFLCYIAEIALVTSIKTFEMVKINETLPCFPRTNLEIVDFFSYGLLLTENII